MTVWALRTCGSMPGLPEEKRQAVDQWLNEVGCNRQEASGGFGFTENISCLSGAGRFDRQTRVRVLIPARGGSKGVPGKNSAAAGRLADPRPFNLAARHADAFDRVVVSTDSVEIVDLSKSFGAEVPFLRPAALAQDRSS